MLKDLLAPDLLAVFTGTSVATASVSRGHYYAGPGNKFFEFLWDAGLTGDRRLIPEQDAMLLQFRLGITDLVKGRAASSDALLSTGDYDIPGFINKIESSKPFVVAFNGREVARRVARYLGEPQPPLGLAPWKVANSAAYVLPSSSGSSANPRDFAPRSSKAEWWREFGAWLIQATAKWPAEKKGAATD